MRLTTTTPPTSEPVISDDVKENALIRTDDDDSFIDRTITIAREMIEDYAKVSMMPQTKQVVFHRYELEHHPHPELYFFIYPVPGQYRTYLPRPPIMAICQVNQTSISEDGMTEVTETIDPSMYYLEGEEIVLNIENIDPNVRYFTTTYTTGYDSADDVPMQLKQAIIIAASDHYDNRTSFVLSPTVKQLCAPFRRQRLMSNVSHGSSDNLSGYNSYNY